MSRLSPKPFIPAEIVPPDATGVTIKYSYGFNCSGTTQPEVLQIIRHPDGVENTYVIMRGLSPDKARAIAMILNAPEEA